MLSPNPFHIGVQNPGLIDLLTSTVNEPTPSESLHSDPHPHLLSWKLVQLRVFRLFFGSCPEFIRIRRYISHFNLSSTFTHVKVVLTIINLSTLILKFAIS